MIHIMGEGWKCLLATEMACAGFYVGCPAHAECGSGAAGGLVQPAAVSFAAVNPTQRWQASAADMPGQNVARQTADQ